MLQGSIRQYICTRYTYNIVHLMLPVKTFSPSPLAQNSKEVEVKKHFELFIRSKLK